MRPSRKWTKPIWRPLDLKCTFLHSQTRYQRNFNGYIYVFWDRLSIGTHENTMRPNRQCKIPIWRFLNMKCIFLHYHKRYERNSRCYTYVFWNRLSVSTHENIYISKAKHMFSGTGFSLVPTRILCDQTGSATFQHRGLHT